MVKRDAMKASYHWLRALVPQLTASPKELAARFTQAGLEVEGTHEFGAGAEACLVVARRLRRGRTRRSRGLNLVTVDRGGERGCRLARDRVRRAERARRRAGSSCSRRSARTCPREGR